MGTGASVHAYSESSDRSAGQSERFASLQSVVLSRLAQETEGGSDSAPTQPPPTTAVQSTSIPDMGIVETSTAVIEINVVGPSDADVTTVPVTSIHHPQQSRRESSRSRSSAFAAAGRKFFAGSRSRWSRSPSPSPAPFSRPMVRLTVQRTGSTQNPYTLVSTTFDESPTRYSAVFPKESLTTSTLGVHPPPVPPCAHPLTAALPEETQLEKVQAREIIALKEELAHTKEKLRQMEDQPQHRGQETKTYHVQHLAVPTLPTSSLHLQQDYPSKSSLPKR